jgi:alpha-tubulin suppressor-like RCC1 family protein
LSCVLLLGACTPRGVEDTRPDEHASEPARAPKPELEPMPKPEPVREPVSGITEVAAGVHHTCAKRDGRVYCWGYHRHGMLGVAADTPAFPSQPDTVVVPTPVIGIESLGEIVTLDLDYDFGCVLTAAGEVHCWGANENGQLGTGDQLPRSQPTRVENLPAIERLAVSYAKVCATTKRGEVWCWGTGELGDGTRHHAQLVPLAVTKLSNAEHIADNCMLRAGKVLCWGNNAGGQVGNGEGGCERDGPLCPHSKCLPEETCKHVDTPVEALGLSGVVELDAGAHQRYARMPDAVVWQWGQTATTMSFAPRDIYRPQPRADIPKMVEVSAGGSHACARTEAGELWCWGNDSFGQLGFEQSGRDHVGRDAGEEGPRAVAGLPKVRAISAGFYFTCVLAGDGEPEIWCWGDNGHGQLGDGTIDRRSEPAPVRW